MKTDIVKVDADWMHVKNVCRSTVSKDSSNIKATEEFRKNLIISEHSPIRKIRVSWRWEELKSWIATHYSRHLWECYISTQRSDRTKINRDNIGQGALVSFEGEMNGQNVIDTARKRLCMASSKETRNMMLDLKKEMLNHDGLVELSNAMVPNCIYRYGCSEPFQSCSFFDFFLLYCEKNNKGGLNNIQNRYNAYNEMLDYMENNKRDKNDRE